MSVAQAQLDAASAQVRANAPPSEAELARLRIAEAEAARDLAASRVEATRRDRRAGGRAHHHPGSRAGAGRAAGAHVVHDDRAGADQLVALVDERYLGWLCRDWRHGCLPMPTSTGRSMRRWPPLHRASTLLAWCGVEVKLDVDEPPAFLLEDMTVSIEVVLARRERAVTIPLAALRDDGTVATGRWADSSPPLSGLVCATARRDRPRARHGCARRRWRVARPVRGPVRRFSATGSDQARRAAAAASTQGPRSPFGQ
ncbi:MAG: hypothetical protein R3E68_07375 [Burkholderiaceae bacterium]